MFNTVYVYFFSTYGSIIIITPIIITTTCRYPKLLVRLRMYVRVNKVHVSLSTSGMDSSISLSDHAIFGSQTCVICGASSRFTRRR